MLTKLFVGLTFFEDNHFAKKIQSFRGRYDEKLITNPTLYMPIVAPFEVPVHALDTLAEDIADEMDGFFPDHKLGLSQGFTGVDVYGHARKMLLYLHPQESADLTHCSEYLAQICLEHVEDREHRPDTQDKHFLTIGRFQDPTALHGALSVAQREFEDCTVLPAKAICLFRKHNGVWMQQQDLHCFQLIDSQPLHEAVRT